MPRPDAQPDQAKRRIDAAGEITLAQAVGVRVPFRGVAAAPGVYVYERNGVPVRELVDEAVLADPEWLAELDRLPVTIGHAGDNFTADTIAPQLAGDLDSGAAVDGESRVVVSGMLRRADAIAGVRDGTRAQLSIGYYADTRDERGVWRGQPYDVRQTRRWGANHVALVPRGRSPGTSARLDADDVPVLSRRLDVAEAPAQNGHVPKGTAQRSDEAVMKKIKVRGIVFDVADDALAQAIEAEAKRADEAEAAVKAATDKADKLEGQVVALAAERDKARKDAAEGAGNDRIAAAAKERLSVMKVGGMAGLKLDEMDKLSDHQIRAEVVKRETGTDMSAKSAAAVEGAFDVVSAGLAKRADAAERFRSMFEGPAAAVRQDGDDLKKAEADYFARFESKPKA